MFERKALKIVGGVDPHNRRQMRRVFQYALNNGLTMILTSHSMEECQILSNRMGILSKGQFQCLGNVQYLKSKFGNAYSVNIKVNSEDNEQYLSALSNYLTSRMDIKIHHRTDSTILFQVDRFSSPAKLFDLIEQVKSTFHIETYTIQQTTLEQIFISLQNSNVES